MQNIKKELTCEQVVEIVKFFTVKRLASELNVTPHAIYQYRKRGIPNTVLCYLKAKYPDAKCLRGI